MSDPVRWRDPSASSPPEATKLLAHARQPPSLDAATRGRVGAQLARLDAAGTAKTAGQTAGTVKLALIKGVAVVVLGASLAVGITNFIGGPRRGEPGRAGPATSIAPEMRAMPASPTLRAPETSRSSTNWPGHAPSSPPVTAADREPAPLVRPRASTTVVMPREPGGARPIAATEQPVRPRASAGAGAAAGAISEDSLEIESRLVGAAHELLERDPAQALAQIDAYARLFPNGQLAPEAEFVALTALARLGRNVAARERGQQLLQRFPRSPQAGRVRRILSTIP